MVSKRRCRGNHLYARKGVTRCRKAQLGSLTAQAQLVTGGVDLGSGSVDLSLQKLAAVARTVFKKAEASPIERGQPAAAVSLPRAGQSPVTRPPRRAPPRQPDTRTRPPDPLCTVVLSISARTEEPPLTR